jgi:Outer membrane protein beta-barrel domain
LLFLKKFSINFKPKTPIMKIKLCSLLLLAVICLTTNAQVQFGINAGPNMSKVVSKFNGTKVDGIKSDVGFIGSADVNIPIGESLLFQTGVQFENVGTKSSEENTSTPFPGFTVKTSSTNKSRLNFINVPAKIYYKLPVGAGSFMIGAGPYLGIGISGKRKGSAVSETTFGGNTTRSESSYDEKVKFGSNDTTMKRINFGAGVNLAFQMANGIKVSLYSNIGLANLENAPNYKTKITTFGLTVGYVFGGGNNSED